MKLIPTRNMAAYLRKIAIDGYILQVDHSDIKAMTAEIQKIGVNVNQIAKRVNAMSNVYQEDIEEIKGGWMRYGGAKLLNVAALQVEYTALQEQKEALYADYGRLKKQVKEYDVIKRNIDSILRQDREPERGRETEL